MVIPQPLKVEISDWDFSDDNLCDIEIPNCASNPSRGSHTVRIENVVYIDKQDFRAEDSDDYFGLAPGKIVGLKYAFRVRCESFEADAAGEVVLLRVVALPDSELPEDKPKGSIQWVPASTAVPMVLQAYAPIYGTEVPADLGWEAELNAESEVELPNALAEPFFLDQDVGAPDSLLHLTRVGYFLVSKDTSFGGKSILTQLLLFSTYTVETDDMSVKQRTAKARHTAQVEKRKKLTSYLAPPAVNDDHSSNSGSAKLLSGSGKQSMAERADLARSNAEHETQAKIEQMKLAKQEEFSLSTAGGIDRQSARLEQEQLHQLKLARMKQEKLAEFVPRKAGGVSFEDDGEEGPRLTPLQRKEEMKRRAEQEKQERLAEFLRKKEGSGGGNEGESAGGVKDRFEQAKRLQQQTEEERLERIRLSRGATPSLKNVAIKDVWTEAMHTSNSTKSNSSNPDASLTPTGLGEGQARAKSKWEQALNESKQSEEQRVNNTKRQTIAQFRLTDGTGFVKKRIGEWEELFVELAATVEELEQTLMAARLLSEKNEHAHDIGELHRLQKEFRDAAETPEDFELGSTRIFNIKLLDFHVAAYIKRTLQDVRTKHFALSCGVYGDQEGGKPPVDIYAAAIKADEKTIYIALTIKATPGFELDPRAYGVKKVAIFSKDVNQKMLERLVNIVPQKGWEGWVARGTYEDADTSQTGRGAGLSEDLSENPDEASSEQRNAEEEEEQGEAEYLTAEEVAELEARGDFSHSGQQNQGQDQDQGPQSARKTRRRKVQGQNADGTAEDGDENDAEEEGDFYSDDEEVEEVEGQRDLNTSFETTEQDETDGVPSVFKDIMGAEGDESFVEVDDHNENGGVMTPLRDGTTEVHAYSSQDVDSPDQHARPSKAEIKTFLDRTFSASTGTEGEGGEEEEEEEEDDLGEDTWKSKPTPKKSLNHKGIASFSFFPSIGCHNVE